MKHYIDIQAIIEKDTELKQSNARAFEVGDIIQITEKIDGSNASIEKVDGKLLAFSRKQPLDEMNTLEGFYTYVQTLSPDDFEDKYIVFGEWLRKNKIVYEKDNMFKWYVFDIFDKEAEAWMPQSFVKQFCADHNLTYVNVLYEGEFISWEHCRTFMHSPKYGDRQEGIVVKNQTKLNDPNNRQPFYLKLVNEDFKESKAPKPPKSAEELAEDERIRTLAESIVTERRVEKAIFRLRDDGVLPDKLQPSDMKLVAQKLPKAVYDDCVKEEKEVVDAIGAKFGKVCGSITMAYARKIILE